MSEPIDQPTGYIPHGPVVAEANRVALVSDVLFEMMVAAQQAADPGQVYTIDWGQPRNELVTYYVPVVTATPEEETSPSG